MELARIVKEPTQPVSGSVVWLHGLGASGHDFEPVVPLLGLPEDNVRFIFPHAPVRPVTINGGMPMPAWFDMVSLDESAPVDTDGVRAASRAVQDIIAAEVAAGVPANKIVLAGFSQGGGIALHAALTYPETLAGVLALSTYVSSQYDMADMAHPANQETVIWLAHGTDDEVLPFSHALSTKTRLLAAGHEVIWREYPMAHEVCQPQLTEIGAFLHEKLS